LFGTTYPAEEISIQNCKEVYLLPAVAAYIGGDITADLLTTGMKNKEKQTFLLDIGTNGEMVLGTKQGFVCCATAAGPAFEGAEISMGMPAVSGAISKVWVAQNKICIQTIDDAAACGICGSGLIDALAVFLQTGLVDKTGMIVSQMRGPFEGYLGEDESGSCIYLARNVKITQEDIRKLQLAKASIAAGIDILLKEQQLRSEEVSEVFLAGGFGSCFDQKSAAAIGLFPKAWLPVTQVVGNAAGEGAAAAALSRQARKELGEIQQSMQTIELAAHPDFYARYVEQMQF
jgi:uncharacterized 2Fe-2S/4Fe-4S cluster protein (DUF4445 family)